MVVRVAGGTTPGTVQAPTIASAAACAPISAQLLAGIDFGVAELDLDGVFSFYQARGWATHSAALACPGGAGSCGASCFCSQRATITSVEECTMIEMAMVTAKICAR